MKYVYGIAGLVALCASCLMAIIASGGMSSQIAPGLVAMTAVLIVGSAAVGHSYSGRHWGISIVLIAGMLAGESGAMVQTAQRVTSAREAMRAPAAAKLIERRAALEELAQAQKATPSLPDTSRLEAAQHAKALADQAAREKATERGCRENCRALLQDAVDNATREVDAARAEVSGHVKTSAAAIAARVADAKTALIALPEPPSATPLADDTGLPEWALNVFEALALSFAINLPGSALVALAVAMAQPRPARASLTNIAAPAPTMTPKPPSSSVAKFLAASLQPDESGTAALNDIFGAYKAWCQAQGVEHLTAKQFIPELQRILRKIGIATKEKDGRVYCLNVRLAA